jgi:hypothetical protein
VSKLHVVKHLGELDVRDTDGGKIKPEGLVELHREALGVEVLEEEIINLDDVLQRLFNLNLRASDNRRRLGLVLEEVHGHERRRVGLPDDGPVNLDAEQTKLKDVLAGTEIRSVGLLSLASELHGTAHAGSHSLWAFIDVFDGSTAEQPAELGL